MANFDVKIRPPKIEKSIFPANPGDQFSVIGGAKLDYQGVGEGGFAADCAKKKRPLGCDHFRFFPSALDLNIIS